MDPFKLLEFDQILTQLSDLAMSGRAKERLISLSPSLDEGELRKITRETTEARTVLDCVGSPPLTAMKELKKILGLVGIGSMLLPDQLTEVGLFLSACRRMKLFLKRIEYLNIGMAGYGASLFGMEELFEQIDRSIRNGAVDAAASPALRDIRRKIDNLNTAVKSKLESILRGKKEWVADGYVTMRSGRFVLPVKREYKNFIDGSVVELSASGGTCFIEPASVRRLQEEIGALRIEEDNEVRRILYTLTALIEDHNKEIEQNRQCMEELDFIFAKAKLSQQMKAVPAQFIKERKILIRSGRHPLLQREKCVPLDFEIGGEISGVVITGPNTGGKTVALKTVGLLSLMAQSGLHVPVEEGSAFCMQANVLGDIGDGQSITENLSTFSSHLTNIISILKNVTGESLVLLDELGAGTDPAEGMGLALSILEELKRKNCLFVATTHYPQIKRYAGVTEGLVNARMEFDRESLQPLYRLRIGEAGESCALYIAKRLGFPEHMLRRAYCEAYGEPQDVRMAAPETDFADAAQPLSAQDLPRIRREEPVKPVPPRREKFHMGDSVLVYPKKEIGIVYQPSDEKGMLIVQIKGVKRPVNHRRLKLLSPAEEMYPDNYDFSIVFDTVENRKARHRMDKGHQPELIIEYGKEDRI